MEQANQHQSSLPEPYIEVQCVDLYMVTLVAIRNWNYYPGFMMSSSQVAVTNLKVGPVDFIWVLSLQMTYRDFIT